METKNQRSAPSSPPTAPLSGGGSFPAPKPSVPQNASNRRRPTVPAAPQSGINPQRSVVTAAQQARANPQRPITTAAPQSGINPQRPTAPVRANLPRTGPDTSARPIRTSTVPRPAAPSAFSSTREVPRINEAKKHGTASSGKTAVFSSVGTPPRPPRVTKKPNPSAQTQIFSKAKKSPPADDARFQTSLNWRRVGESGESNNYKAPHFKGTAREYIPNASPKKDPSSHKIVFEHSERRPSGLQHIKSQSPRLRRERTKQNRRKNLESLHRENFRQQFRVVSKKKRSRGFYLKMISATLALYLLFLGAYAAYFSSNLVSRGLQERESIRYTVGTKDETGYLRTNVLYKTVFRNDVLYLNMNHIASLCRLTTTGNLSRMRYSSRAEGADFVTFFIGQKTAIVNGAHVTLSAPAVLEGESVYVPIDFFDRFVTGLDILWDEEKSELSMKRQIVSTSIMNGNEYADLCFGLDKTEIVGGIAWESLDLELRMRIEAAYAQGNNPIPPASDDSPQDQ